MLSLPLFAVRALSARHIFFISSRPPLISAMPPFVDAAVTIYAMLMPTVTRHVKAALILRRQRYMMLSAPMPLMIADYAMPPAPTCAPFAAYTCCFSLRMPMPCLSSDFAYFLHPPLICLSISTTLLLSHAASRSPHERVLFATMLSAMPMRTARRRCRRRCHFD